MKNEKVIALQRRVEELEGDLANANTEIEELEKEMNFYFGKLRQVEMLCRDETEDAARLQLSEEAKKHILGLLYHVSLLHFFFFWLSVHLIELSYSCPSIHPPVY